MWLLLTHLNTEHIYLTPSFHRPAHKITVDEHGSLWMLSAQKHMLQPQVINLTVPWDGVKPHLCILAFSLPLVKDLKSLSDLVFFFFYEVCYIPFELVEAQAGYDYIMVMSLCSHGHMTFKMSLPVSQSQSVWQENKAVICIYRAAANRSAQGWMEACGRCDCLTLGWEEELTDILRHCIHSLDQLCERQEDHSYLT